jgi:hypothetical protein
LSTVWLIGGDICLSAHCFCSALYLFCFMYPFSIPPSKVLLIAEATSILTWRDQKYGYFPACPKGRKEKQGRGRDFQKNRSRTHCD